MSQLLTATAVLLMLSGCDTISPFVGEELKASVCDRDHDGLSRSSEFCGGEDCDDGDQEVGSPTGWYRDVDLDTYGAGEEEFSCSQPEGFVIVTGDCDDTDELVSPGGIETCNEIDDDCDGDIDEENITTWYLDADEDTYGNVDIYLVQCDEPMGYVDNADDCDDLVSTVSPDGTELCDDDIDQDCNGLIDDAEGSQAWYADADQDSYGDPQTALYSCNESVEGYVLDATDCDDANLDVNPSANEACLDHVDNDCDGEIDTDAVDVAWYADVDEDGYGDVNVTTTDCAPPEGYVGNSEDCDDASNEVNPGVDEVCNNGIDDNCDDSPGACVHAGASTLASVDVTLTGDSDSTGWAIVGPCDLDGSGELDLVASAPDGDQNAQNTGSIFIFFNGSLTTSSLTTSAADVVIVGDEEYDYAGSAVACGDVDRDGVDDLLFGAFGDDEGGSDVGAVAFFPGTTLSGSLSASDASSSWVGTEGATSLGERALAIGDVDGNGSGDLVVGWSNNSDYDSNAGALYFISGDAIPEETVRIDDADAQWLGEATGDRAGLSIGLCDLNSDGAQDILTGSYGLDDGGSDAGGMYLIWGDAYAGIMSFSESDALWTGESAGDLSGSSIACNGDVDDDGVNDILVSAPYQDEAADNAGAVYLIYGADTFAGEMSLTSADAKWIGETSDDQVGNAAAMCDIDDNGMDDIFVSSINYDGGSSNLGIVYMVSGGVHSGTSNLSSAEASWTGTSGGSQAGSALSCPTDLNNDNVDDLAVGAPTKSEAYLIFGLGY